ncbi:hypothetical protein [Streptomyces sclerotialus]|uniref:hypothetical protein n=1 Tax=Streptomyces sclerotialus TaxID=1957 RepID=UPI0004C8A42D
MRNQHHQPKPRLRRAAAALALVSALTAATAACGGPGGVELGTDWKGARNFALADVNGELTVVGVNPERDTAEPLVVVPSQKDDDRTLAPQIVRLADDRWVLAVPRKGGKPDRLYEVDREERAVAVQRPGLEATYGLYPAKSAVAAVPGFADRKGGDSTVRVRKGGDGDWSTVRTVKVPGTVSLAASDTTSDRLCVSQDAKDAKDAEDTADGGTAAVVDLESGTVTDAGAPRKLRVQQLACADGRPVLAGTVGAPGSTSAGSGAVEARRKGGVTVLTSDGARFDQVAADGGSLVAAVFHKDRESLVRLDARTGEETARVRVPGLADAEGMQRTKGGWLLFSDNAAVRVDLDKGTTKRIPLPGRLLAS